MVAHEQVNIGGIHTDAHGSVFGLQVITEVEGEFVVDEVNPIRAKFHPLKFPAPIGSNATFIKMVYCTYFCNSL